MERIVTTYKYRIQNPSARRYLQKAAKKVNLVWNYCNATSYKAIRDNNKFLSYYDLAPLIKGTSKEIGLHSQTVQGIAEEYVARRVQFKKRKLRWRISKNSKKSLGWVPFKGQAVKIENNFVTYLGQKLKFKMHRNLPLTKILSGSFNEDSKGNWYVNFAVEIFAQERSDNNDNAVGIDLGLKTSAALSDNTVIENPRIFAKYQAKLAKLQRHSKRKQARNLQMKIKNSRKDFLHKASLKVVKKYKNIYIGNVSAVWLQATNGKSSQDASIGALRQFLKYKAIKHSGTVVDVNEKFSTITCSVCFEKIGPNGLSDLSIREWKCGTCFTVHNRDANAAKNILRIGSDTLIRRANHA